MRKLAATYGAIFVLLIAAWQCFAQVPQTGAGTAKPGGGVSFVGPLNAVTGGGTIACYSLRACSAALAGTKAIRIVRASDSAQTDINTLANGNFDVPTATTFCNATTCTLTKFYDQTANVAGYDLIQATVAAQPTLVLSCIGALPCTQSASAQDMLSTGTVPSSASGTLALVYKSTGAGQFGSIWSGLSGNQIGVGGGNVSWFGSGIATVPASNNNYHVLLAVSGGGGTINVDNAATASGSSSLFIPAPTPIDLYSAGGGGNPFLGQLAEAVFYAGSLSAGDQTILCHNQFTYWSTSVSC